jgi:phosphoribosylaminoimidazole-succinocarboxamide synthase
MPRATVWDDGGVTSSPALPDQLVLPGWRHRYSGKVRDLYVPADLPADSSTDTGTDTHSERMLVVASDRVSAFDHVLSPGIPGKGALLTTLSLWWFERLAGGDGGRRIPNHLTDDQGAIPDAVAGRAMIVQGLDMLPIECVVRGFLTGSGWAEYRAAGTVCGIRLPSGLRDGDRLPAPIFTPAYKAPLGEHDENISFDRTVSVVGADRAERLRDLSLEVYERAAATAEAHGLLLADTKFEFGLSDAGELTLADEVLTSDSSRYWDAASWERDPADAPGGRSPASFDKQIVRDWLAANWAPRVGEPPSLPAEIVTRTAERYSELLRRLTA